MSYIRILNTNPTNYISTQNQQADVTGPTGPSYNWAYGTLGYTGPIGYTGSTGPTGIVGITGSIGSDGPIGNGTTGSIGNDGITGSIGNTSSNGTQGPIGPDGPAGPAGPAGSTGSSGDAGGYTDYAGLVSSSNQLIPTGFPTIVTYNSITSNSNMTNVSTSNGSIEIKNSGLYLVNGYIQFAQSSVGTRGIILTAGPNNEELFSSACSDVQTDISINQFFNLTSSSQVTMSAYQTCGSSMNINNCTLSVTRIN